MRKSGSESTEADKDNSRGGWGGGKSKHKERMS